MSRTIPETSAGSFWTSPPDQEHAEGEETVATPAILFSRSVTSHGTTTIPTATNEPGLSSRRGIHKTIHLPPLPSEHDEMPPALSTAALMTRAYELDQLNAPVTPVEKLIPTNPSNPPPAPISKKTRVHHPTTPVRCNTKSHAPFLPNSSPRSPLAPRLMNMGPLASPIHLVDPCPCPVDSLPSPVSEKIVGASGARPVSISTMVTD